MLNRGIRIIHTNLSGFLKRTVAAQLHLLGVIAAIIGLTILMRAALLKGAAADFWACLVYGVTSIVLFSVSTIYHFMSDGFEMSNEQEMKMENLDHIAIFLFIAGTYTPFILNAMSKPWSTVLMWFIWLTTVTGIVYTQIRTRLPTWAQHRFFITGIFVFMGWLLLVRLNDAVEHMTATETTLLITGAMSYTLGAVVYAIQKPNPLKGVFGYHEIWHLMVLLGYGFHYALIFSFYS